MHRNNFGLWFASLAAASLVGPAAAIIFAQSSQPATKTSASDKPYDWKASFAEYKVGKVARTADGKPDLQGIWSRAILTPMERPAGAKDKKEIDSSTVAAAEDAAHQRQLNLRIEPTDTPPGEKTTDAYNAFWRDGYFFKIPMTSLRTSQVVDPPDGRIPPMTPEALQKRYHSAMRADRPATGPEDRPIDSRCLRPLGVGPAFSGSGPGGQASTLEIVQSPKMVVVRTEALESQIVYMDGRPRPPEDVHLEQGAARGHWDGDTLVVEYTNFADDGVRDGTSKMHLTERWKRLDDLHMLYGFTMDDPGTWTKPWSVEFVMWRLTDQEELVEYACHEGNVGIEFTLSAARAKEKEESQEQGGK
jgi:hypothetical protein